MKLPRVSLDLVVEIAVTGTIIAAAWIYTASVESYAYVPLSDMLQQFREVWFFSHFESDIVPSLIRLVVGYSMAVIVGATMGFLLGMHLTLRLILYPVLSFLRSIPPITLVPAALFVIGIGNTLQISIIALVCIWPILLNVADGVAELDDTLMSTAKSYDINGLDRFRWVVFPAVGPRLAVGMRTSVSFAVLLLVTSEMIAGTSGIGVYVFQAQQLFAIADMWAGIILLGLLGIIVNIGFGLAERRLLHWHLRPDARRS